MKRLGWAVLAVLTVAGCGGSEETAPANPWPLSAKNDTSYEMTEPVNLFGESVGAAFPVPNGSIAVTEVVEIAPGQWGAVVSVEAVKSVTEPLVFDGTFTALDAVGAEHVGTYSDAAASGGYVPATNPPQADYGDGGFGGELVIFETESVQSVTYTTTDGVSFIWWL